MINKLTAFQPYLSFEVMTEHDVELIQSGKTYLGKGTIEYRWARKPGFSFSFHAKDNGEGPIKGDAIFKNLGSAKHYANVKIDRINLNDGISCRGFLSNGFGWGNIKSEVDEMIFYVPNFIIEPLGPLSLKYNDWEISLTPIENVEKLYANLDENGGFAFTYSGRIANNNGNLFTMDQSRFLIRPLRMFLSFVRGAWCDTLFLEGAKEGKAIFGNYSNPLSPLTQWTSRALWCSHHDQENLNEAFNGFMAIFSAGNVTGKGGREINAYEHLSTMIIVCIEAGLATFGEWVIVFVQSALESIAYSHAKETLDPGQYATFANERTCPADEKIRWVLQDLSIPVDIPPESSDLQKFINERLTGTDLDGPKAITYLRNAVIHGSAKLLTRVYGKSTDAITTETAMNHAIILGTRYMELAILHKINYKGKYTNRLTRDTRQVPWATGTS